MSWRFLWIGALLVAAAVSVWWFFRPEAPIKNIELIEKNDGPMLIFGDSLAEGVGAKPGADLASRLTQALGEPVLNYGVAGDTTTTALTRIDTALAEKPRLVMLLLGGNDFLRNVPRETTAQNLEALITTFQNNGAVVLLLGVRSGILSGGSDEFYAAIAQKTGAAYEADILKGVFGNQSLMSDAIHPNDAGYAKIVDRLLPTLKDLLER